MVMGGQLLSRQLHHRMRLPVAFLFMAMEIQHARLFLLVI